MKKLFVVLLTAVLAITLMLKGCAPPEAKGPQAWWEGAVASSKGQGVTIQVLGANGSLGKQQVLPDGAKIRAILDADLKPGKAVSLCRGTRMYALINNQWNEVNTWSTVTMNTEVIINDFGLGDPACTCYSVYAVVETGSYKVTVFDLVANRRTSATIDIKPGTRFVTCACKDAGSHNLNKDDIIFLPMTGVSGSGAMATPCIVESPMTVTITGKVGVTTDPGSTHE